MAIPRKQPPSPATVARVRQQYADGCAISKIRADNGVTKHEIYFCIDGGPRGPERLPPIKRRRVRSLRKATLDGDKSLIEQLWRTARQKVGEVEDRLTRAGVPEHIDRDTRALASLVRTLRELAALNELRLQDKTRGKKAHSQSDTEDDDPVPRDIDEFRAELARRIEAFVATRTGPGLPGDAKE